MKKLLSIVLTICMLCSFLGTFVYAAYDKDNTIVTYGGKTLPIGNYKDGKRFTDTVDSAVQCLGFAFYVQDKLFGFHYKNSGNKNGDKFNVKKGSNGNLHVYSIDDTKALFNDVTLGAHIRTGVDVTANKSGNKYSHSMIFMKSDRSNIWTYEGNADGKYGVYVVKRTWEEMYNYLRYKKDGVIYIATPKASYYSGATENSTTTQSCKHSTYNSKGYCTNCGKEYPMNISSMTATTYQAVKNDVPVRNRPYSPEKIIKYLSKGAKVTVVASGKNSIGNLWYKLSDNTWVYSSNLEKVTTTNTTVDQSKSTLGINLTQYPTNITKGKAFNLTGNVTSNYNITSVKGYIINSSGSIVQSTTDKPNAKSMNIQPASLNQNLIFNNLSEGTYTLKVEAKDSSGRSNTWSKSFTVKAKQVAVTPATCNHSYNKSGYCSKCNQEYPISLNSMTATTYEAVKNDVPVRNRPYSPEKIIKYLSKGAKVTVVASGKNSIGNLWYKLSDNTWVYSENLTKSSSTSSSLSGPQTTTSSTSIRFELESVPKGNLPYGKPFSLKGWFRSDCAIVEARAYILDANKNIVMQSDKASSTTSNYQIQGYKLDNQMQFNKLSPGGYYLKYYVRDANGDTATWISDLFYIVK